METEEKIVVAARVVYEFQRLSKEVPNLLMPAWDTLTTARRRELINEVEMFYRDPNRAAVNQTERQAKALVETIRWLLSGVEMEPEQRQVCHEG